MEEKERYEWNSPYDSAVRDNKNDDIINAIERLNEQDKRIKELENENKQLKQQLAITEKALELACEEIGRIEAKFGSAYIRANGYLLDYFKTKAKEMLENERMIERNFEEKYKQKCNEISALKDSYEYALAELKQQLHDLPKKIVEEIRDDMSKRIMEKQIKWGDNIQIGFICNAINECLDTILKKFGEEDE